MLLNRSFFFEISWRSRARPLIPRPGISSRALQRSGSYKEGDGMVNGECLKLSVTLDVKVGVALVHGTLVNMVKF